MRYLASILLVIGVLIQILVPLHIIDVRGHAIAGIPSEIVIVIGSAYLITLGIIMLYSTYYGRVAGKFQESFDARSKK